MVVVAAVCHFCIPIMYFCHKSVHLFSHFIITHLIIVWALYSCQYRCTSLLKAVRWPIVADIHMVWTMVNSWPIAIMPHFPYFWMYHENVSFFYYPMNSCFLRCKKAISNTSSPAESDIWGGVWTFDLSSDIWWWNIIIFNPHRKVGLKHKCIYE